MTKRPTLKDVALHARVSEMTASRVLRNKGEASEHTKERVLAAAKAVGYVPNRIAGALSSRTVNLVGVVVPSISSFVFSEVLTGISDALKPHGLQPIFGITEYDLETEEKVIREMLSWRPSGLIVAGLEHTDTARAMMRNAGVPVAEIMDTDGDPVDINVGTSHLGAGYDMGKTVLERGYRKIGYIGTKIEYDFRANKRLEGFVKALAEEGVELAASEFYTGGSTLLIGRELTAKMLDRMPDIDCIYYSGDIISAGGLMHCLANGVRVPQDLAIAGFSGLDLLKGLPLLAATTNASRYEMGKKAAELIVASNAGTLDAKDRIVKLDAPIDVGDTL
jgi:LacI family gluconate utilization system Gnt-I transcriptional repressor